MKIESKIDKYDELAHTISQNEKTIDSETIAKLLRYACNGAEYSESVYQDFIKRYSTDGTLTNAWSTLKLFTSDGKVFDWFHPSMTRTEFEVLSLHHWYSNCSYILDLNDCKWLDKPENQSIIKKYNCIGRRFVVRHTSQSLQFVVSYGGFKNNNKHYLINFLDGKFSVDKQNKLYDTMSELILSEFSTHITVEEGTSPDTFILQTRDL